MLIENPYSFWIGKAFPSLSFVDLAGKTNRQGLFHTETHWQFPAGVCMVKSLLLKQPLCRLSFERQGSDRLTPMLPHPDARRHEKGPWSMSARPLRPPHQHSLALKLLDGKVKKRIDPVCCGHTPTSTQPLVVWSPVVCMLRGAFPHLVAKKRAGVQPSKPPIQTAKKGT